MISTHILDTSVGNPAAGVKVVLEKSQGQNWNEISNGVTNADGRFVFDIPSDTGDYRITFYTVEYFKKNNAPSFFLDTTIAFKIEDTNRKYHVPLLLNPFGYSSYRGS